jgi:hypothetical protein
LRTARGWEAGVDGNVALFTIGGGQNTLSAMNENPVLAFVFDVKGLIADGTEPSGSSVYLQDEF